MNKSQNHVVTIASQKTKVISLSRPIGDFIAFASVGPYKYCSDSAPTRQLAVAKLKRLICRHRQLRVLRREILQSYKTLLGSGRSYPSGHPEYSRLDGMVRRETRLKAYSNRGSISLLPN